jgi:hypothetical protein
MHMHTYLWIFGTSTSIGTPATYNKIALTQSFFGFQHGAKGVVFAFGMERNV